MIDASVKLAACAGPVVTLILDVVGLFPDDHVDEQTRQEFGDGAQLQRAKQFIAGYDIYKVTLASLLIPLISTVSVYYVYWGWAHSLVSLFYFALSLALLAITRSMPFYRLTTTYTIRRMRLTVRRALLIGLIAINLVAIGLIAVAA